MDSQDSRWIPKIRDGFAGFAMDSQDSQDSQGFADIRKDSRIIRGRIHDKFAKIRKDSRWCHRVHMYTRTVNPRMNPLILLMTEAREPATPLSNTVLSLRAWIDGNEPVPATNPRANKVPIDLT